MRAYVDKHQPADPAYDAWFRAKVQRSLDDPGPDIPHEEVMKAARRRLEAGLAGAAKRAD